MDFIDKLSELSNRIDRQKDSVKTEEAAKTAFVLPFLQALGYDIFNPLEVIPELNADHGLKKGEKVDYAIKHDEKIIILIECKSVGAELEAQHASQLFRYFSVTEARFGVLTDGVRYLFFSDLEKSNQMDSRPFFEFNLLQFEPTQVKELKKFTKNSFNLETIISTASNLKYHKAILEELQKEFESPSEDLVKTLTLRVYEGRFTKTVKEQFTELTKQAMTSHIREMVRVRLQSALEAEKPVEGKTELNQEENMPEKDIDDGIITTETEIEGHKIVQAIGSEIIDPERIVMRDAKSYCAILLDDNNRKTICRFYFGKRKLAITIFNSEESSEKQEIQKTSEIFRLKEELKEAIKRHESA